MNILGLWTIGSLWQLCHCRAEAVTDNMQMSWVWLCPNKTLFKQLELEWELGGGERRVKFVQWAAVC